MDGRKLIHEAQVTLAALLLAGVLAVIAGAGCAGKQPPRPETVTATIRSAAQVTCALSLPATERDAARRILGELADAAALAPEQAYWQISDPSEALKPGIALIWSVLHLVLDQTTTDGSLWVDLAMRSVADAAEGCLAGIGGRIPVPV